jgi:hypothetical protein
LKGGNQVCTDELDILGFPRKCSFQEEENGTFETKSSSMKIYDETK